MKTFVKLAGGKCAPESHSESELVVEWNPLAQVQMTESLSLMSTLGGEKEKSWTVTLVVAARATVPKPSIPNASVNNKIRR